MRHVGELSDVTASQVKESRAEYRKASDADRNISESVMNSSKEKRFFQWEFMLCDREDSLVCY